MRFDIITIFPGMFASVFDDSLVKKAREAGILDIRAHDLRSHTLDKHRRVDDYPFGGGVGMILTVEPVVRALEAVKPENPGARTVLLSPSGARFDQRKAWELSRLPGLILVCGRYEGVDQRVCDHYVDEELSIGDFVLSGGEIAAMTVIDAVARLVPGVIGDEQAVVTESFERGLLEYPQYTRPREFRGHEVPEILLSGDHARIRQWQEEKARAKTERVRPDLLK